MHKFESQPGVIASSLQACVGKAAGIELSAFIENLQHLPDVGAILNGADVPVPESIDLQYALASSLVGHSVLAVGTPEHNATLGNILEYANKFPQREMGVMLVSDIHRAIGEPISRIR